MKMSEDLRRVIDQLYREKPLFHSEADGQSTNWAINAGALDWLATHLGQRQSTLETGAGYSTVAFLAAGCQHTVVSPSAAEHKRIRDWCLTHQVPVDHVTFHDAPSQIVLPGLDATPLDVALIDGAHAFPFPFLDWYYTAIRLRVGGHLLVDDTQLRPVEVLKEFLLSETGRWLLVQDLGRTAVFRKQSPELFSRVADWPAQPFCADWEARRVRGWLLRKRMKAIPVVGPLAQLIYRTLRSGAAAIQDRER